MRPVEPMLEILRPHYESDAELTRVMLNATSWFEASLALGVLADRMSPQVLVTCANVREIVKELPRCPLPMSVDLDLLTRVWGLEREKSAWVRRFDSPSGEYSVELLAEGNYLYDIVVRTGERAFMLMPHDRAQDFINPELLDLMVARPEVLASIVDLTTAMGLPIYPMFYMSLEDWQQEYAAAVFGEILEDFDKVREPVAVEAAHAVVPKRKPRARHRKKKVTPSAA